MRDQGEQATQCFGPLKERETLSRRACWLRLQERLLMCYAATHPEKLDAAKQAQWQKLARLREEDMNAVLNLEYLGVPVRKRGKASGLSFGRKRKRAVRKARLQLAASA